MPIAKFQGINGYIMNNKMKLFGAVMFLVLLLGVVLPAVAFAQITTTTVPKATTTTTLPIDDKAMIASIYESTKKTDDIYSIVSSMKDFQNFQKYKMSVYGTEYIAGDFGKAWIQLLNANSSAITGSLCYMTIYTPANTAWISSQMMTELGSGLYYMDFIVPNIVGVYPVVAYCYVGTGVVQQFVNASAYDIVHGVYNAGIINDTWALNGVYLQIKETGVPSPRRLEVDFNFTDACEPSELEMGSATISWEGTWTSVDADRLYMYIWNYTSSSWLLLSNSLDGGAGDRSFSNNIMSNNLSKSGFAQDHVVRVRFVDTNMTDGTANNFYTDRLYLSCDLTASAQWQLVKGGSEIHVTSLGDGISYGIATNAFYFADDTGIFGGSVHDNFTVASFVYANLTELVEYEMPSGFPCETLLGFYRKNKTSGSYENMSHLFAWNSLHDDCHVMFYQNLSYGSYEDYSAFILNYGKADLKIRNDAFRMYSDALNAMCYMYYNRYNMTVPLNPIAEPYNMTGNLFENLCNDFWSISLYAGNDIYQAMNMAVDDEESYWIFTSWRDSYIKSYDYAQNIYNTLIQGILLFYGTASTDEYALNQSGINISQYMIWSEISGIMQNLNLTYTDLLVDLGNAQMLYSINQTVSMITVNNTAALNQIYALLQEHNLSALNLLQQLLANQTVMYNLVYGSNQSVMNGINLLQGDINDIEVMLGNITLKSDELYLLVQDVNQSINGNINDLEGLVQGVNQTLYWKIDAVNQTVMFKLYSVQSDIADVMNAINNLNATMWIINSSIVIPTEVNLTNASLSMVSDDVIYKMLQNARILNDRVVNFHNHEYCIDNMTLQHNVTYDYCIGEGNCKVMKDIMNEACSYGCDYDNNQCKASPLVSFIVLVAIIAIIGIAIVAVGKYI